MEAARMVVVAVVHEVGGKPGGHERAAEIVANALTKARRDGMRRAAEIAYTSPDYTNGERDKWGLLLPASPYDRGRSDARIMILSQAGESS